MIRATTFSGQRIAVFGLGASGNATVASLLAGGATVAAWDDSEVGRAAAAKAGVPLVDLSTADWSQFSSLVLAPGVPLTHPEPHWTVEKARTAGVEIIGDVEIFSRERAAHCPDAPFIAITGTNGKSTTTALVAHILREAGKDVQMGGNIGRAILTLEPPARDRFHVIEMSSFQIDLTPTLHPTVGVLLNITPDHLDRHGTIENYAAVKRRLVEGAHRAVVGVDDKYSVAIAKEIETGSKWQYRSSQIGAGVMPISVRHELDHGVFAVSGRLYQSILGRKNLYSDLNGILTLRGAHNWQNAAAAFAATKFVGVWAHAPVFKSFAGLPHRLEVVKQYGPIDFINDSKATNADSTERALASFTENIFWILGGKPKDGGIESLRPYFSRIAKAYLIGQATEEFAATLGSDVRFERCGTLDVAVGRATADALAANLQDSVVLLSPACASYDQFKNFEVRGDAFRAAVASLPGIAMRQAP